MAFELPGQILPMEAGGNISASQFRFVTLASDGQVDLTGAASTNRPIGVLQNKPAAAGLDASVMVDGVTKLFCGETIAIGDLITPSASVAGGADDADTSTDVILGQALEGGDVGEIIAVYLFGGPGGEIA